MHPLRSRQRWTHPFMMLCAAAFVVGQSTDLKGEPVTISWTGGDSSWFETNNWNLKRIPISNSSTTTDVAEIINGGTARIEAAGAEAVFLNVGGTSGSGRLCVGSGGTLNVAKRLDIHAEAGYSAVVDISGGTTDLGWCSWIYGGGSNLLNMTDGVLRFNTDPYFAFTPGSKITVRQSGGLIDARNKSIRMAKDKSSYGSIGLSGNGVVTNLSELYLGFDLSGARGSLSLSDNAALSVSALYAGGNKTNAVCSTGTVAVCGGVLAATTVTIGYYGVGEGTLTGGLIRCGNFYAGDQGGSRGTFQISGGTLRTTEDIVVGKGSNAYGHIQQEGGTADIRNLYLSMSPLPANASYTLNGGTLWVRNAMTGLATNNNETFTFTGGTLSFLTYMNTLPTLTHAGGTLSPGLDVAGKSTVDTNYVVTSAAARLSVNLGGTSQANAFTNGAGYYDFLNVTGSATLAGELEVSFINGFDASVKATDKFYVVASGSNIEGAFANVPSGGRVTTAERHSFAVYYGNNAATTAAGEDPKKVTLTGFLHMQRGTIVTIN